MTIHKFIKELTQIAKNLGLTPLRSSITHTANNKTGEYFIKITITCKPEGKCQKDITILIETNEMYSFDIQEVIKQVDTALQVSIFYKEFKTFDQY